MVAQFSEILALLCANEADSKNREYDVTEYFFCVSTVSSLYISSDAVPFVQKLNIPLVEVDFCALCTRMKSHIFWILNTKKSIPSNVLLNMYHDTCHMMNIHEELLTRMLPTHADADEMDPMETPFQTSRTKVD